MMFPDDDRQRVRRELELELGHRLVQRHADPFDDAIARRIEQIGDQLRELDRRPNGEDVS